MTLLNYIFYILHPAEADIYDVVDVDECDEGTAGCDQNCQNTNSSFVCSCVKGYDLNADNTSCTISKSFLSQGFVKQNIH